MCACVQFQEKKSLKKWHAVSEIDILPFFFELPPGITLSKEIYDASAIVDHAISACDNDCGPCDEHVAVNVAHMIVIW